MISAYERLQHTLPRLAMCHAGCDGRCQGCSPVLFCSEIGGLNSTASATNLDLLLPSILFKQAATLGYISPQLYFQFKTAKTL